MSGTPELNVINPNRQKPPTMLSREKSMKSQFTRYCFIAGCVCILCCGGIAGVIHKTNSVISVDPAYVESTVTALDTQVDLEVIVSTLNEEANTPATPPANYSDTAPDDGVMYGTGAGTGAGVLTKTHDGWLNLYNDNTVASNYYSVTTSSLSNFIPSKWSMGEGNSYTGNSFAKGSYSDSSTVRPNGATEGYVDGSGRYWVAVGPKVTNKDYDLSVAATSSNVGYGKLFDLVIKEISTGTTYYIPCKSGDCKVHTYPTGIIQTGTKIPGSETSPSHNDGSLVEWVGVSPGTGSGLGSVFELIEIRVYE